MQSEKGGFSRYLSVRPGVSVTRDKKLGLYYAKFALDKTFTIAYLCKDSLCKIRVYKDRNIVVEVEDIKPKPIRERSQGN